MEEQKVSARRSKKTRLGVIIGLIVVAAGIAFFFEKTRLIMFGVIFVLLAAFGLEVANTDVDLGSVIQGESVSDSVILRDEEGNLEESATGGLLTRILRDREGNEVPEGTTGAKFTDEYNCDDFKTQPEAQQFFTNAGGVSKDTNRLDGDKDGEACESLPKGSQ
jgi:hypothetical protein